MSDDRDDFFKPKIGRIRSLGGKRSKSYVNRVLHRLAAFGNKGRGPVEARSRFTGTRIGRGNAVMRQRRAGGRFGPAYRRVIIKSRIVKLAGARDGKGIGAARAHLRYVKRDGVSKDHEPGRLYDANSEDTDGSAFLGRSDGDRHQFRFIVSPEEASELSDLKPFVRDLMQTMESDLRTRLDWVAVDHFNTEHPHTHIVLRGKDDTGKDLIIARDYISHGMRRRASELLTLELGEQTEDELRRKLERQIGQHRFTDIDRMLIRDADDDRLDMPRDPTARRQTEIATVRIGRLRALEKLGLADEEKAGRWRLSPDLETTLRQLGERGDIIKTMHHTLREADMDVGAANYAIYDPSDRAAPKITGAVIGVGLHDELNDGHYVLIDGTDGRVHYVALNPDHEVEDVPKGAIVEVHPINRDVKPSDRVIIDVAKSSDGLYSPDLHRERDPNASPEFVQAHIRRLEALRRANVVRRFPDGSWEIPSDFEERVSKLADRYSRYPGKVVTLSFLSLEDQIAANGATWLDRQLLSKEPISFRGNDFGKAAKQALDSRCDHLTGEGLAKRDRDVVRYQRNLLRVLRQRELAEAGSRLAMVQGLEFIPLQDGERVEGVYRKPLRLASGKFAVIEKAKEFTLVPWRSILERYRGKAIGATMRGTSVSFDIPRSRTISIN